MSYAWPKGLESGNEGIDCQHKELFQAFNSLFDACAKGQSQTEILRTLTFLEGYMHNHLNDEELLMRQSGYPDYAAHKACHSLFRSQITSVLEEYRQEGVSRLLVAEVNSILSSWLTGHVRKWDVHLAHYLRTMDESISAGDKNKGGNIYG